MSDLVRNPEDQLSHNKVHINISVISLIQMSAWEYEPRREETCLWTKSGTATDDCRRLEISGLGSSSIVLSM